MMNHQQTSFLLGRLGLDSLPLHEPILVATFSVVALGGIAVFGAITYFRLWDTSGGNGSPPWTTSASASCT